MNNLQSSRRKFIATSALASMGAAASLSAAVTDVPPVKRLVGSYGNLVSISEGEEGMLIKARIRSVARMAEAFQDHNLGRVYADGNRFQFEHSGRKVTIEHMA